MSYGSISQVVMVCCEDGDTVFENIKKALAA